MNMLQISCDFPDTYKYHSKYQRNNKRTGLKNLRCFPFCGPDNKHHEHGFCGASLKVIVTSSHQEGVYALDNFCAWGEFSSKDTPPRFVAGSVFTTEDVNKILRTDVCHLNPLFAAVESVHEDGKQFSFENQKKGWHYEWKGNKYTSDLMHSFVIYVAVPLSSFEFQTVAVFSSPNFNMYCRRRHKTVPESEKAQMATPLSSEECMVLHHLTADGWILQPERTTTASVANGGDFMHSALPPPPPPPFSAASSVKPSSKKRLSGNEEGKLKKRKPVESSTPVHSSGGSADGKLTRILAAVQNIDKLKKLHNKNAAVAVSDPIETDLLFESLDTSWLDALYSGPYDDQDVFEDFHTMKGNTLNDLFANLDKKDDDMIAEAIQVVESLARHLVEEDSFTNSIHKAVKTASVTFADVMQVIEKEVSEFLRTRFALSIHELDLRLGGVTNKSSDSSGSSKKRELKSAFDTLVSAALKGTGASSHSLSSSPSSSPSASFNNLPFSTTVTTKSNSSCSDIVFPPGLSLKDILKNPKPNVDFSTFPDVTGIWHRPPQNTAEMAKWRERREVDWVSRQLLGKMESRFEMVSQPLTNSVDVALSKKLLSSGLLTYVLDAVERPFPLHGPLGTELAKTMVGWSIGPMICFRNSYSDTERMLRANWKVGEDELHGVHIYLSKKADGGWGNNDQPQFVEEDDSSLMTEDGWKIVHMSCQICSREKLQVEEYDRQRTEEMDYY